MDLPQAKAHVVHFQAQHLALAPRHVLLQPLEEVEPGGTVQFAAGTFLVGEIIPIATPRLALLGDPAGTTLRTCEADDFAGVGDANIAARTVPPSLDMATRSAMMRACQLLQLTGGHATVRNLTFEQAWSGLVLGIGDTERGIQHTDGGYLIEDNTFRDIFGGISAFLWARDPSVIRGNRFINSFHAVSVAGSRVHVLDNQISVPEPARVSSGHPGFAILLGGGAIDPTAWIFTHQPEGVRNEDFPCARLPAGR